MNNCDNPRRHPRLRPSGTADAAATFPLLNQRNVFLKRFCFLLALIMGILPVSGAAQTNPVVLNVTLGLGGVSKTNAWTPAVITLENSGGDVVGEVEWRWDGGGAVFAQTLDLPRGARKRVVLPVRNTNFSRGGVARFLVSGRIVATQNVSVDPLDGGQIVVGVISDRDVAFADLSVLVQQDGRGRLVQLALADLPIRPELLQAFDTLIVSADTTALSAEQRSALAIWVADGGQLVVDGATPQTAAGLADLALATSGAPQSVAPADLVRTLAVAALGNAAAPPITLRPLTAVPHTTPVLRVNDLVAVVSQRRGGGLITQSGFGLEQLPDAVERSFWGTQIPLQRGRLLGFDRSFGVLRDVLTLPALRLPSLWALLAFLILYIGLVGPLNYFVLRRFDRREWAYATIPLTVLVFTLGAYVWGTAGRGGSAIVNELTIVQTASGASMGQAVSEAGLFSPTRQSYNLAFPADALLGDPDAGFRRTANDLRSLRTERNVEVRGVVVDVGALQSFLVERAVSVPPIEAYREGNQVVVRNASTEVLQDVVVVQNQQGVGVGDLNPGAERRVDLPNQGLFTLSLRQDGAINRQRALETVGGRWGAQFFNDFAPPVEANPDGTFTAPAIPAPPVAPALQQPSPIAVFAWTGRGTLPFEIDGVAANVQGDTLLIVGVAE